MASLNGKKIRDAATGFQLLFDDGWSNAKPVYPELVMEFESTGPKETYLFGAGAPGMREWKGARVRENAKAYDWDVVNTRYESTLVVGADDIKDDRLGFYKAEVRDMGGVARLHPDELLGDLLLSGFTDLCYDGQAFFSTSHPLMDGTTQSNKLTATLDEDAFETAYAQLRAMKSPRGSRVSPLRAGGEVVLIVPSALQSTAERIVANQLTTGGASNANYKKARVVVFEELDDQPTYWFLAIVGTAKAPFIFQMREKAEFVALDQPDDAGVYNRNEVEYGATARYGLAYGLPERIVGSDGSS